MPTELRVLGFNNAEVIEALTEFCQQTNRPLPESGIKEAKASSTDAEVRVTVEPFNGTSMSFHENEVAAALILFCKKKSIPVARRAAKSLKISGEFLSLHLTIR